MMMQNSRDRAAATHVNHGAITDSGKWWRTSFAVEGLVEGHNVLVVEFLQYSDKSGTNKVVHRCNICWLSEATYK